MKRIYIVVEGQTEQEFVKVTLAPYLNIHGIYDIKPILILTSKSGRGGHVNYDHLHNTIKSLLASNKTDFVVTTFVDFFKIPHNMPKYQESMARPSKLEKVEWLQNGLAEDVGDNRFFPYIQLHEFEALLFSDNVGFDNYCESKVSEKTAEIISQYPNPEDINSTPEGAPSKRILSIYESYDKVLLGNLIASEIGIEKILNKCPRFRNWVNLLIEKAQ